MVRLRWKPVLWIHIIAWIAFISYEVPIAKMWDETNAGLDEYVCYYILDIFLFYINADLIARNAGKREKILLLLIPLMLLELGVFFSLSIGVGILLYKIHNHWMFYAVTDKDCAKALWRVVYIMGLSTGYGFFRRAIKAVKEKNLMIILQLETEHKRIEIEKDFFRAQNAHLQAQINKHLLLNTLTFIYSCVFRAAPEAGQSVLLLSETMQYALTDRDDGKVALSKEVEQIERYILLNQLRYNHELKLSFKTELDGCSATSIPPLLLLTFVENIFKHGNLVSYEQDAEILIYCKGDVLKFHTENYKKGWKYPGIHKHIGISNARTRLESHYGADSFDLDMTDTEEKFIVDLTIRL